MKEFEVTLSQELKGFYEGKFVIAAKSKQSALKKLRKFSKTRLDETADWTHGDHYDGDKSTIVIESVDEI